MSNPAVDVAIVGAGPYGLCIAAYLNAAGVDCRVFGEPMQCWSRHMPPGMYLKSDPAASDLFAPGEGYRLEHYCRTRGIAYHPYAVPVALENFIAYGRAFQQRFVPQLESRTLRSLHEQGGDFHLEFAQGAALRARRVVLAIGVVPFRYVPPLLRGLPADLASHSSHYGPLDPLHGRDITIVGAGASAQDLAALLSARCSSVTLVARAPRLISQPPPRHLSRSRMHHAWRRIFSPPSHGLGDGWFMRACADAPWLIHALPPAARAAILRNTLGPSGAYALRDRLMRNVTMRLGRRIERIEESGAGAQLITVARDGAREVLRSDHIVAATGYRVDLHRLRFLDAGLLARLRVSDQAPILSMNFESSVPGLYFTGLAAAHSFGPALRFVLGAIHPARRLATHLPASLLKRPITVPTTYPERTQRPAHAGGAEGVLR
jgi:cation diffusion facilitator CzcD-associated flavoprotein CzcO